MAKVTHYQHFNNDFKSYCGRATLYVGDVNKKNSSIFRNRVTCEHCKVQMKKDGLL